MSLSKQSLERYSRQIVLSEIGVAGQERLLSSTVLVVGAGGLGAAVLPYLIGAGVGRVRIMDGDCLQLSNLQRQILYREEDVGKNKAEAALWRLTGLNSEVVLEAVSEHLSVQNAASYVSGCDVVIDCSDNFGTRYLVNDICAEHEIPFVSASILRSEGQIAAFLPGKSNYRDLFPEPPSSKNSPRCAEAGVLGAVAGVLGAWQAAFAVQVLLKQASGEDLLLVNLASHSTVTVALPQLSDPKSRVRLQSQAEYDQLNEFCSIVSDEMPVREISVRDLRAILMQADASVCLVDVREPFEKEMADLGGVLIPLAQLHERVFEIPRDQKVVVYCQSGGRSAKAIQCLQEQYGYTNLQNLRGGMLAWSAEINASPPSREI
ncbi:MAG: HesA/MoeB/ThiF family protein [Bdellovibrionales bacterium]|nr:HesA/MoeB/ThiF family protein [Bdellovibrionales bacterium]